MHKRDINVNINKTSIWISMLSSQCMFFKQQTWIDFSHKSMRLGSIKHHPHSYLYPAHQYLWHMSVIRWHGIPFGCPSQRVFYLHYIFLSLFCWIGLYFKERLYRMFHIELHYHVHCFFRKVITYPRKNIHSHIIL